MRAHRAPEWLLPVAAGLGAAVLSAMLVIWLAGGESAPEPAPEVAPPAVAEASLPSEAASAVETAAAATETETAAVPAEVESPAAVEAASIGLDFLFGAFRSYSSVERVRAELEKQGVTAEAKTHRRPTAPGAPTFQLDELRVAQYHHLEQPGTLQLRFFNDQLYEAEFEPADPEAYRALVRKRLPPMKRGSTGRAERVQGNLRLASSLDLAVSEVGQSLKTRPYLLWQDLRLIAERDSWDDRQVPQPSR